MNKKMLEMLVCPKCGGKLDFLKKENILYCSNDKIAYPVQDGIPVLLVDEAVSYETSK